MIEKERIHGFIVDRIRPVDELNAQLIEMTHEKTGLELAWIKREEENKTFGIAFETLPWDDTGVFHILEHSVLCGSDRYPVKEPFVELMKNSMNTFLNAMTFPDKTVYPISSRNDKDFINLMRVYLDAVFNPLIYSKPEIFRQEGWHYEFDENEEINYKGVVYNEMRGALASPDELETIALSRALFPDSPYRFVSGGDPASIPDLSYEDFVESHKKFYSPSNGRIFLDGSVNIDETLRVIDEEFLKKFDKSMRIAPPELQKPVDGGTQKLDFEIGEDEDIEGKNRIAWAGMIGAYNEREKLVAMQILADVLCGSNQSLLNKPILSKRLAENVIMQVNDGIAQSWITLEAQNIKDGDLDKVEEQIFTRLTELAEKGIDHSQIEASMANMEFQMRERDYGTMPQGLVFGFSMLENWLYGGDPIANLQVGDLFTNLRKKMSEGYFEKLIKDVLLDNPHRAKAVLSPSRTVGEERRKAEAQKIENRTCSWSEEQRNKVMEEQEILLAWQNSEDDEEQLALLPHLELSDLSQEPEDFPTEVSQRDGITTLYHDINCSGIINATMFFDADDLTEEEISELSFLTDLLGKMKTSDYSEEEIDKEIRMLFGNLSFFVSFFAPHASKDDCRIKMCTSFGALSEKSDRALAFAVELLKNTDFDSEETAHDLLRQLKTRFSQQIVMSGSSIGVGRVFAQHTAYGAANECGGGFKYYKWLCKCEENWNWKELKAKLEKLQKRIVCSNRLTLSVTGGSRGQLADYADFLEKNLARTGERTKLQSSVKPWGKKREGIAIPADISFACAAGALQPYESYSGNMNIASNIIKLVYLWNVIRVQGGAYGTGFSITRSGIGVCHSYRDPNAAQSLQSYEVMADFLEEFCKEVNDLDGFIIGAVSDMMPLLTPKMKGLKADEFYWSEVTLDDRRKLLKEMISATPSSVGKIAGSIRKAFEAPGVCVVSSREQLELCQLDTIETL